MRPRVHARSGLIALVAGAVLIVGYLGLQGRAVDGSAIAAGAGSALSADQISTVGTWEVKIGAAQVVSGPVSAYLKPSRVIPVEIRNVGNVSAELARFGILATQNSTITTPSIVDCPSRPPNALDRSGRLASGERRSGVLCMDSVQASTDTLQVSVYDRGAELEGPLVSLVNMVGEGAGGGSEELTGAIARVDKHADRIDVAVQLTVGDVSVRLKNWLPAVRVSNDGDSLAAGGGIGCTPYANVNIAVMRAPLKLLDSGRVRLCVKGNAHVLTIGFVNRAIWNLPV